MESKNKKKGKDSEHDEEEVKNAAGTTQSEANMKIPYEFFDETS